MSANLPVPDAQPEAAAVPAVAEDKKSSFDPKAYFELLATGPKSIRSVLAQFNLPSTSSGRQRLRDANEAFNKQFAGSAKIEPIWITEEGKSVKAFQVVAVTAPTQ